MPDKDHDLPSLEALEKKIAQVRPKAEDAEGENTPSDYSQAFRFTADLLGGVIIGAAIGYGIDSWTGWLPWATIVCLFLGTAAGIRNMMRSAKQIESKTSE